MRSLRVRRLSQAGLLEAETLKSQKNLGFSTVGGTSRASLEEQELKIAASPTRAASAKREFNIV